MPAKDKDHFKNLFEKGQPNCWDVGYSKTGDKLSRNPNEVTAMMALNRISAMVIETGVDETGLGRWAWVLISGGGKVTRIVTVIIYQPCEHIRVRQ